MTPAPDLPNVDRLLADARRGFQAMGEILQAFQTALGSIADWQLAGELRAKLGASDLIQGTYEKALAAFPTFKGQTTLQFWAWLRAILKKHAHDLRRYYRRLRRNVARERPLDAATSSGAPPSHEPSPSSVLIGAEERLEEEEERKVMLAAVNRLKPGHRMVLLLREWHGLTFEDIGQVMNRSGDAAKKLFRRAIQNLRKSLLSSHERQ